MTFHQRERPAGSLATASRPCRSSFGCSGRKPASSEGERRSFQEGDTNLAGVLAIVEQCDGRLARSAQEVVSTAASLASELGTGAEALVLGGPEVEQTAGSLGEFGAETVKVAVHQALSSYHPDGYVEAIEPLLHKGEYEVVLLAASAQGKDLAPRLAARLDVPLLQDITGLSVDGEGVEVTRPIYAGKALARVRVEASPLFVTLRPNGFPVRGGGEDVPVETISLSLNPDAWLTRIVSLRPAADNLPDVSEASIVVSGGRGMKGPEHWGLLEELRESLGPEAGLGASRAVVDAGWRPHAEQVGQTGKTVSPRLYFAIGISGAIQHLAGMRTAVTIVAINKDPRAPIFGVADYGIVGDVFEILPRLTAEIRALRGSGDSGSGAAP